MRLLIPAILFLFAISLVSCQKDVDNYQNEDDQLELNPHTRDSLSFTINDQTYTSNKINGFSFANKQMNIKPHANVIATRQAAYTVGGYWWYGDKDSLLFEQTFSFESEEFNNISFGFSKKYATDELVQKKDVQAPINKDTIFQVGETAFVLDNNLENSTEGVHIALSPKKTGKTLTSSIPAYSVLLRSSLDKKLQDDAYFQIIKIDTLQNNELLIEARFEINLYDEDETVTRLKDGFVRFKTKQKYIEQGRP